jgi:hypothetical protein
MNGLNTLELRCSAIGYDFIIDGISLLQQIAKHEQLDLRQWSYVSSLGTIARAEDRLLLQAEADLTGNHVALYVCSCGGYDGNPIGARLSREGAIITWSELGFYSDIEDVSVPVSEVTSFRFAWPQYVNAVSRLNGQAKTTD